MTASAKQTRSRRGRTLVVGNSPDLAGFVAQVRATSTDAASSPVFVNNLFEALGEVTHSSAATPIGSVIIETEALDSASPYAIEALRKIDPSVRIILLAKAGSNAQAIGAGVDERIKYPTSPAEFARLFDDDSLASAPIPQIENAEVARASGNGEPKSGRHLNAISLDELRTKLASSTPSRLRIEIEAEEPDPEPQASEALAATHAKNLHPSEGVGSTTQKDLSPVTQTAETKSASLLSQGLGDSDLVEAVMSATGDVPALAIRIIQQQSGWSDVAIVPQQPSGHLSSVELAWEGRRFGWLQSTMTTSRQLSAWGTWLSRWLSLDANYRQFRVQSLRDDLTGAWNRRFFDSFLAQAIHQAASQRRPVTVMVFDLDNFKSFNDEFGHEAGDEILRETVKLLNSVIRQGDRVCRIGGDEFAVIFADPEAPRQLGSKHPESIDIIAHRFQDQICKMRFPKLGEQAPGTLSISAGLATFPWDGHDPQTLLRKADQLALESKRKGKNAITMGRGTTEVCRLQRE